MLIKICGITNSNLAQKVAASGVDMIGVLFTSHSVRQIDITTAQQIKQAINTYSTKLVGVFFDETASEILALDKQIGFDIIQLHGDIPRQDLASLIHKPIIYVVEHDNQPIPQLLDAKKDYLLYEGVEIPTVNKYRFFVAGGINIDNVTDKIRQHNPDGIDLSSGVEIDKGVKDFGKIREFLQVVRPTYYGAFGGMYVPELLINPLDDLISAYKTIVETTEFHNELINLLKHYVGRPTALTKVTNFGRHLGLNNVYLKREDLAHTGAHKINNALGQCLLAKKMGKTRIIAETGAGQHGVATATACAMLGIDCVIYMGSIDVARQAPNVAKMKLLGAQVVAVDNGSATLKDAVNEALRDWSSSYENTHYCLGTALGPYPFPQMCALFQSVIGKEARTQFIEQAGVLPEIVIACVGGGSNAIGIFQGFLADESVKLIGVEAGGTGDDVGQNAARFHSGRLGVLHGNKTYVLQTVDGQIADTHSISAGLDYAAVGPQHADLFAIGRAQYDLCRDEDALKAFKLLIRTEGIIPALESSHALGYLMNVASQLSPDCHILINLSGRGDKDLPQLFEKGLV